ncbi:von Willebrand factor A domain-containing protein 1 [Bombina bombina]|uniref:von Willebrand factor A domain-containing protein 1 n=1 Tax=Bombina bombina TaxID=8345 RepID=UPI00235B23FB|nr:von Willebrand factor A domain-containing protein 1 [Bombina bombina]
MIVCLALYVQVLLLGAAGQSIPEADPPQFVPDSEGDLTFLLDSSGSVSYYEFAKVKEFIKDLLHPFKFGPQDVQASIVHISTEPVLEFPFNQYDSSRQIQGAIQNIKQQMGDTNTGKALAYVKENLTKGQFGSRENLPKVMVWVTDGLSTDDISQPMQMLKDMGVTVFIVSTGRGNYLELSSAASQPSDTHLHFVDVDDLRIITKELRDSIIDIIRARRLQASDITTSSFRLTWPRILSGDTGHYMLEYSAAPAPERKLQKSLSGDETSVVLDNLIPGTIYNVTLFPESNVQYVQPQTIQVSTLPDEIEEISPAQVLISEPTSHGFRVSWGPTLDSVTHYEIQYGPLPSNEVYTVNVTSNINSTVLENLKPNTTYLVTVSAIYKSGGEKALSAIACTEEKDVKVWYVRLEDLSSSSLNATWGSADGEIQGYVVHCSQQTGPSSVVSVSPQTHNLLLTDLTPGSTNQVCVMPIYKSGPGKTMCSTVQMQTAISKDEISKK